MNINILSNVLGTMLVFITEKNIQTYYVIFFSLNSKNVIVTFFLFITNNLRQNTLY